MILHFDFETTGFPIPGAPSSDPRHCKPVSLSAALDDANGIARRTMSMIVRPEGYALDDRTIGDDGKPTAFSIHGISNSTALKYGMPLNRVICDFVEMMHDATVISAFNTHFDEKIFKICCALLGNHGVPLREVMETKQSICTMEAAAANLIGKKRISLKNAYFEMFKQEIQLGHHGSLEDTMASRRVYWELVRRGHPMVPKSLAAKVYDTPYVAAS